MDHSAIAYCGLLCGLCRPDGGCSCKSGQCGKMLSPNGCYQYTCCKEKGLKGCWECDEAPCGRDMLTPDHVKIRAFLRYIQEVGVQKFLQAVEYNEKKGAVYHRNGILGDFDLPTEQDVLELLRSAEKD